MTAGSNTKKTLLKKIASLPAGPGVYQFRNKQGILLYIGKARSLRHRVQSYMSNRDLDPKTARLVSFIDDVETIQTSNELEALILESNLIKRHKPPFNINLRDDKHYPFLQLTVREPYPRLRVVRRIKKDGSLYYGPYIPARGMRNTLRLINKYFGLRQCSRSIRAIKKKPCINYQMGRCLGPCSTHDNSEYDAAVERVRLFLEGKKDTLTAILTREMAKASDRMDFEKAAVLRDQIKDVQVMLSKQNIISRQMDDLDALGYCRDGLLVTVDMFHVRSGRILGRHSHRLELAGPEDDEQVVHDFLTQYYLKETYLPDEILVPFTVSDEEMIMQWLSERKGRKVLLRCPVRGRKKEIIRMVTKNARVSHLAWMQETQSIAVVLEQIRDQLRLSQLPCRIEGYDISHTRGYLAVGSMVVWENNRMNRSAYRRFKIKSAVDMDDYAMIAEVVRRRFDRGIRESQTLPELVLIDGGLGHVNAAYSVLKSLNVEQTDMVGIAKGRALGDTFKDRFFKPHNPVPIILSPHSQTLHIMQQIRDEAHRFALAHHTGLRGKRGLHSLLDEIPGVGPKRKKLLLRHFGNMKKLKHSTLEELKDVKGLDKATATKIYNFFQSNKL